MAALPRGEEGNATPGGVSPQSLPGVEMSAGKAMAQAAHAAQLSDTAIAVPPRPRARRRGPGGARLWRVTVAPGLAVAVQIRWARQGAGLTQAALATRAGVSQQQIAKLERPGENPTLNTLTRVAAALGVALDVRLGNVA